MLGCNRFEVGSLEFEIFTNIQYHSLLINQGAFMNFVSKRSCISTHLKNSPLGEGQEN